MLTEALAHKARYDEITRTARSTTKDLHLGCVGLGGLLPGAVSHIQPIEDDRSNRRIRFRVHVSRSTSVIRAYRRPAETYPMSYIESLQNNTARLLSEAWSC